MLYRGGRAAYGSITPHLRIITLFASRTLLSAILTSANVVQHGGVRICRAGFRPSSGGPATVRFLTPESDRVCGSSITLPFFTVASAGSLFHDFAITGF